MLTLGAEVTLEREGAVGKTRLRGWREEGYLLFDLPDQQWRAKNYADTIGRMMGKGKYLAFTTQWLGVLPESNLMIFRYPDDIMGNSVRQSVRYDISLPVVLFHDGPGGPEGETPAIITDLSTGGCRFATRGEYRTGGRIYLRGTLPGGAAITHMGCFIRSVTPRPQRRGFIYGAQFELSDNFHERSLKALVKKLSEYHLGDDTGQAA